MTITQPKTKTFGASFLEGNFKTSKKVATKEFVDGIDKIHFTEKAIPNFKETNKHLKELTGWQVAAVPGIVDDDKFFELLSNRIFPATTWLRTRGAIRLFGRT